MNRQQRRLTNKEEREKKAGELSKISDHERKGKELIPSIMTFGNLEFSSWMNARMPEMLWAILVISTLGREDGLRFFRAFSEKLSELPEDARPKSLNLSDIGEMEGEELKVVLDECISILPTSRHALRPLLLFPELPGLDRWSRILPAIEDEDFESLMQAVAKALDHQSQEATDCRWVRVAYMVLCNKLVFTQDMEENLKEIMYYPNYGDQRKVGPSIRAAEIVLNMSSSTDTPSQGGETWPKHFWSTCLKSTPCLLGESIDETTELNLEELQRELDSIRAEVANGFINTQTTTEVDSRHDGAFGLVLYALDLSLEVCLPNIHDGSLGRIGLRSIIEAEILLAYLIKLDDEEKWRVYRSYGAGQAKLAFLKLLNTDTMPDFIQMDVLEHMASEDAWQEFVPINLGNWDGGNLRKMSETAAVKNIYDSYYDWTSGYIHAQWAVVRDTVYTTCLNPLHRLHRVPRNSIYARPSVSEDIIKSIYRMLVPLKSIYPF